MPAFQLELCLKPDSTQAREEADARRLKGVIAEVRATPNVETLMSNVSVRLALKSLGLSAHIDFLRVLHFSRPVSLGPGHLAALSAVSHDRRLCRNLQGSFLHEELIFMLTHRALRRAVTRRFILEMNHPPDLISHSDWYTSMDAVVAALECGFAGTKRIHSLEHYWRIAQLARQKLNSASYRLPKPPFALPKRWRWFETADEFKHLAGYSAKNWRHQIESYHASISRSKAHLLRDPQNRGWIMERMQAEPSTRDGCIGRDAL